MRVAMNLEAASKVAVLAPRVGVREERLSGNLVTAIHNASPRSCQLAEQVGYFAPAKYSSVEMSFA